MIGSGGLLRLGTPECKWGIGMKADGLFQICHSLMSEIVDLQSGKTPQVGATVDVFRRV